MSNMEGRGSRLPAENFESIEEAVRESPRGRWFLAEYAARLRDRETKAIADQVKSLETAVIANHDAIMARLAVALGQPPAPAPQSISAPPTELAPRHMKFFKRDEEIFEAAPQAEIAVVKSVPVPEEKRGAKLTIRRSGETAAKPAEDSEPAAVQEAEAAIAPSVADEAAPAPVAGQQAGAEEHPKRRIVIIRHKPGESVDVPLHDELARAS